MSYSVYDSKYLDIVKDLIEKRNEILITVRYPYQAGNKDLFLFKSIEAFEQMISKRASKDLIIIDKSIKKITQGIVTDNFIKNTLDIVEFKEETEIVVIFPEFNGNYEYWHDFFEDKEELEEYLNVNDGHYVFIYEEANKLNEDQMVYAYVPDADGKIQPGVY